MIQHPYLLLLLILFPVYFCFRNRVRFYFRHAHLDNLSQRTVKTLFHWQVFMLAGTFFITLAAANFMLSMTEKTRVYQVHKYVLVNDGSGSMVDNSKENGVGEALTALISGNEKLLDFLGKRQDGSKDLIGAIVFSNDAFIVAGLTDDPPFVQQKLRRIDYRLQPLSGGTNIELGLWSAVEMLISNNDVVKQDELEKLQVRFYSDARQIKPDDLINSIVLRKEKFAGGSIIIFTDGIFNPNGDKNKMSAFRIIDFCKMVGIRVYFISVYDLDAQLVKACKETGGRGDIIKGFNKNRLEAIYSDIVVSQASEYTVKEQSVDHSLSRIFGGIGLWCILVGFFLHTTIQLNFTEV